MFDVGLRIFLSENKSNFYSFWLLSSCMTFNRGKKNQDIFMMTSLALENSDQHFSDS